MPFQLVREVLGHAKTFSNKFNHLYPKVLMRSKTQLARNTICVQYLETIKSTIHNEWNGSLMKRLRQSIADPLWPAHEKRSSRRKAYKASSLPLWSDVENHRGSPSGVIITFSLWQSSNSHTLTNGLKLLRSASLLLHNTAGHTIVYLSSLCFKDNTFEISVFCVNS